MLVQATKGEVDDVATSGSGEMDTTPSRFVLAGSQRNCSTEGPAGQQGDGEEGILPKQLKDACSQTLSHGLSAIALRAPSHHAMSHTPSVSIDVRHFDAKMCY